MKLSFKRDTQFRKQFFVPDSFAHPAKMDAQLLIWIVERYTKPGEVILDPMAGSGTTMLACILGRDVILVELEDKFTRMCLSNWQIVKMQPQLGSGMGNLTLLYGDARQPKNAFPHPYMKLWLDYPKLDIQSIKSLRRKKNLPLLSVMRWGDARQLEGLLVDKCIFSPPYAETLQGSGADAARKRISEGKYKGLRPDVWTSKGNVAGSTFGDGYSRDPDNISNLPYGQIDKIVTSPPFGEAQSGGGIAKHGYINQFSHAKNPDTVGNRSYMPETHGESQGQIGNLPYGDIDAVITSPPFAGQSGGKGEASSTPINAKYPGLFERHLGGNKGGLSDNPQQIDNLPYNIGSLKSDSYLEAMLAVYRQSFAVLKPGGLAILVCKNFIRNKQVIRLDLDTIKLCEQAGFSFLERHSRKLPAQSFWRIIYHQKHPEVEQINHEDILVFQK